MIKRITIFFLPILLILFLAISAFALTKEERAWKEDILTLLSLVKRVGDYSEVVDLIEVAPALKKDPEIKKAYIAFAPPGATPPEWAKEEKKVEKVKAKRVAKVEEVKEPEEKPTPPAIVEVPEKIEEEKEEARRIAQEVAAQKKIQKREVAPLQVVKEEPKIEAPQEVEIVTEGPPEKIVTVETTEKVSRWESEQVSREEQRIRPTPLPKGAKVIYSTDVVSEVRAEMVEGKMRVTITLSGERKYTVSERGRPPAIIIDIPHTINAVFPGRIMVNQGGVRIIEVTQYRSTPFDETRVIIRLSRFKEYEITSSNNEIYVEFEE